MMRSTLRAAVAALAPLLAGCMTGSTLGSGVGDTLIEHPPYYAGATALRGTGAVAHLPITWQRGAVESPLFEPASGANSQIDLLVAEMNAYLDTLGASSRVVVEASLPLPSGSPPDVRFGCNETHGDNCAEPKEEERGLFNRRGPRMRLAVGRPSNEWISGAVRSMERNGAPYLLVISLEAGQYFVRQQGWQGRKVVELGTGYTISQPWLTAIDRPVDVVQLTGALIDRSGKAVRIGVEGLLAKRTGLLLGAAGARALLTDDDVRSLRAARRDELPGQPLVWQVALKALVEGLLVAQVAAD